MPFLTLAAIASVLFLGPATAAVQLNMALGRQTLFLGQTLPIELNISTDSEIVSVTLQLFVRGELDFEPMVISQNCLPACKTQKINLTVEKRENFHFDKVRISTVAEVGIFSDSTLTWDPGTSRAIGIELRNLSAPNMNFVDSEFVIALLKFWDAKSVRGDAATQKLQRNWFKLVPVLLETRISNSDNSGISQFRPNDAAEVLLIATAGVRAFPIKLYLDLPHRERSSNICAGKLLDGTGYDCSTKMERISLVRIFGAKFEMALRNGATLSRAIQFTNSSSQVQVLLNSNDVSYCLDPCQVNLSVKFEFSRQNYAIGDFWLRAKAFYSTNLTLFKEAQPRAIRITGSALNVTLFSSSGGDLEAFSTVKISLKIRHHVESSENVRILKLSVQLSNTSAQIIEGSCLLWKQKFTENCNETTLLTEGFNLGILKVDETLELQFWLQLTQETLVSSQIFLSASVDFAFENIHLTPCLPSACQHGGICVRGVKGKSYCQCPEGFTGPDCAQAICPKEWFSSNGLGNCYYFPQKLLNFQDAQNECAAFGASLAVFNNGKEQSVINQYLYPVLGPNSGVKIWLGQGQVSSGQWQVSSVGENCTSKDAISGEDTSNECNENLYFLCVLKGKNGTGEVFTQRVSLQLPTKKLVFERAELGLGDTLSVHQTLTTTLTFLVPLGVLRDVALDTRFHSAEVNPMPIKFMNSEILVPATVYVPNREILRINSTQLATHHLPKGARFKRESTISVRIFRKLGDIINLNTPEARIQFKTSFVATGEVDGFSGAHFEMDSYFLLNGQSYLVGHQASMFAEPKLRLEKIVQPYDWPGVAKVTARILHRDTSTGPAHNVQYEDDIEWMKLVKSPREFVSYYSQAKLRVQRDTLAVNESLQIDYLVSPTADLPNTSYRNASANYSSLKPGELIFPEYPGKVGQIEVSTCLIRQEDLVAVEKQHDHTASGVVFTVLLLLGLLLALLMFGAWIYRKRRLLVVPDDEEQLLNEDMNVGQARHVEVAIMTDPASSNSQNDSIIPVLSPSDQQQTMRILDRQSVLIAAKSDDQLQEEKLKMMVDAAVGTITAEGRSVDEKLRKRVQSAMSRVDKEFSSAESGIKDKYASETKKSTKELKESQKLEQKQMEASTSTENPDVKEILNEQHSVEMENLLYRLQLEQDLAIQNLKSEFEARKEAVVEQIHGKIAAELLHEGKIDEMTAENLTVQMSRISFDVTALYDEETARQRAMLEHRYNLRKNLALRKNLLHKQRAEVMNMLMEQHYSAIERLEQQGLIGAQDTLQLKTTFNKEVTKLERWFETERKKGERQMQSRMAREKKLKVEEMKKQHNQEIKDLDAKFADRSGTLSPMEILREHQKLLSEQRKELMKLEGSLDENTATELEELHEKLTSEVKKSLQDIQESVLKQKGFAETDGVMHKQAADIVEMEDKQKSEQNQQSDRLESELNRKKSQLQTQVDHEIDEQRTLREQEMNIFQHLLEQQAVLSDRDRDELLRLQRENGAQLQTSLTVHKLTQLTLIEQKISKRRASKIELIEKSRLRKTGSGESRSGAGKESPADELENIRSLANEKLAALKESASVTDKELEAVEKEMLERRSKKVRRQENRLGTTIATLQIDKTKQITELVSQEDALEGLTSCMVNDLNERGILTNTDCQSILERHQTEQKILQEKLDQQRAKQETVLRHRLQERALRRNTLLMEQQRKGSSGNSRPYSSHVSRTIADFHQIVDQSKERAQMLRSLENEFDQRISQDKQDFYLRKQEALQDQEKQFIRSLAEKGQFRTAEITGVLRMVFPQKPKNEIKEIVNQLTLRALSEQSSSDSSRPHSTSLDKKYEAEEESRIFMQKRLPAARKAREAEKRPRTTLPPISQRPQPVGASVEEITEYLPPKRLATRRVSTTFHK